MMTGNGADIECYADRENQPVQMAVRFWIARNSQLQAIQRAELFAKVRFCCSRSRSMPSRTSWGIFSGVTQCIQVTAFHKMVNINSRATQEIDFQRLFFIADPVARRCGSSGCSIACSMSTRPCSSTPASRNCWSIAARFLASI
ncbi:Uncharacterised protein [Escherichia coli]|uniref:Uncharacterized protein n=1 Tax=Escherichia coli TaxID=562 RepID=A0A377BLS1_ECOLX|nr:Uncharacterised protein [Escherichia coli]